MRRSKRHSVLKHRGAVNNREGTRSIYRRQCGRLSVYQVVSCSRGYIRQEVIASSQEGPRGPGGQVPVPGLHLLSRVRTLPWSPSDFTASRMQFHFLVSF